VYRGIFFLLLGHTVRSFADDPDPHLIVVDDVARLQPLLERDRELHGDTDIIILINTRT
jgi:hypothetical protein